MLYHFDRLKTRAFTLIELIVVIVLLGLLAGLSVPTFKQVLSNAQFDVQLASMQALGRQAAADGLFKEGVFELDEVRRNITSTTPAGSWTHVERSTNFGELASSVSEDSSRLRLAALSSTGECIVIDVKGPNVTQSSGDPANCSAIFSTDEEETPGDGEETPAPPVEETPEEETPEPPVEEIPVVEETPTNINVSYAANAATLTWVGSSVSYKVERLNADGQWTVLTETATDGTYIDSSTQPGLTYSYRVSGANTEGVYGETSESSNEITLAPNAPTTFRAIYNEQTRKNTLTWNASTGATNYTVTSNGVSAQSAEPTLVLDARLGVTNGYTIIASNAGGSSALASTFVVVPGSCEVGRAVACDRVVEADLKKAGAQAAATLTETKLTMLQVFSGITTASLFADNNSGLLTKISPYWNSQGNVRQITTSPGVLIEVVHVREATVASGSWPKAHTANDYCVIARSPAAETYKYPGGNQLLYNQQAYYDPQLGGYVSFKQVVDAYKANKGSSCYGYAKRFLESGGVI